MVTESRGALLGRLGERVRALRKARGWTAREAAERAGLSLRFWSDLEAGRANIAIGRLAGVAEALSTSLSDLVAEDPQAERAVIALLGLRGAGKSTVGPLLAEEMGAPFVELDTRIEEAAGLSLSEIFALHGEAYYRRLALESLRSVLGDGKRVVLALPGGIVHDEASFDLVRRRCMTVWLKAEPADHFERVLSQGDRRPMADRPNAMAELRAILAAREPLYGTADVTVDTSRRGPAATVAAITAALPVETGASRCEAQAP